MECSHEALPVSRYGNGAERVEAYAARRGHLTNGICTSGPSDSANNAGAEANVSSGRRGGAGSSSVVVAHNSSSVPVSALSPSAIGLVGSPHSYSTLNGAAVAPAGSPIAANSARNAAYAAQMRRHNATTQKLTSARREADSERAAVFHAEVRAAAGLAPLPPIDKNKKGVFARGYDTVESLRAKEEEEETEKKASAAAAASNGKSSSSKRSGGSSIHRAFSTSSSPRKQRAAAAGAGASADAESSSLVAFKGRSADGSDAGGGHDGSPRDPTLTEYPSEEGGNGGVGSPSASSAPYRHPYSSAQQQQQQQQHYQQHSVRLSSPRRAVMSRESQQRLLAPPADELRARQLAAAASAAARHQHQQRADVAPLSPSALLLTTPTPTASASQSNRGAKGGYYIPTPPSASAPSSQGLQKGRHAEPPLLLGGSASTRYGAHDNDDADEGDGQRSGGEWEQ